MARLLSIQRPSRLGSAIDKRASRKLPDLEVCRRVRATAWPAVHAGMVVGAPGAPRRLLYVRRRARPKAGGGDLIDRLTKLRLEVRDTIVLIAQTPN